MSDTSVDDLPDILRYPRPGVTVDVVIFTILDADLKILLIRRDEPPFQGQWALPGGFVRLGSDPADQGEDLDQAARRELAEETGLAGHSIYLEQLYTFGKAYRDPRMRVISVAYYALVRPDLAPLVRGGGDAADALWHSMTVLDSFPLAFDHRDIITMALNRIRGKVDSSDIAFELVPPAFSIPELRGAYEIVKGSEYDPGNFRRKFQRMMADRVILKAPGKRITVSKPALVYTFNRSLKQPA